MIDLSGQYFIDGADIWTAFGVFVESGSDDFLKYPPKKDGITHDWLDSNGIDEDVSQIFLGPRDISLKCAILCDSEETFWTNYRSFITFLTQPGLRRVQVAQFVGSSYQLVYKETTAWQRFTRIKDADELHQIACKFTITFRENSPVPNSSDEFIVDEEGRFLIT